MSSLTLWQNALEARQGSAVRLDAEWENILKAIYFGLPIEEAWPSLYRIVRKLSPYMERRGLWETWQEVLEQVIQAARQMGDEVGETRLTFLLARLLFRQKRFPEAIHFYRRTLRLARQIGDWESEGRVCSNLGYYYAGRDFWQRAEVLCCHALDIFRHLNHRHGLAHTHLHLGWLYFRQRRWQEAHRHLKAACAIWQAMGDDHGLMRGFNHLGLLFIETARPEPALHHLEAALQLARRTGEESLTATLYLNLALAHNRLTNRYEEAERYARQAEAIYHRYSDREGQARAWGVLGIACLYQGKTEEARRLLANALAQWRTLHHPYGEMDALLDLVEYDLVAGNGEEAARRLQEAEILLRRPAYSHLNHQFEFRLEEYRRRLLGSEVRQTAAMEVG
ncbi:MAG: tetratricopeptide repeat protein [Caldilineae bacterium]|nr:MAG: tetratricopeptide repeat protein [Caldilineae bacterium]